MESQHAPNLPDPGSQYLVHEIPTTSLQWMKLYDWKVQCCPWTFTTNSFLPAPPPPPCECSHHAGTCHAAVPIPASQTQKVTQKASNGSVQISGAGKKRGGRKYPERGREVTVSHLASGKGRQARRGRKKVCQGVSGTVYGRMMDRGAGAQGSS